MPGQRFKVEEFVNKLWQADVELARAARSRRRASCWRSRMRRTSGGGRSMAG